MTPEAVGLDSEKYVWSTEETRFVHKTYVPFSDSGAQDGPNVFRGMRLGALTVLFPVEMSGGAKWLVECICGARFAFKGSQLSDEKSELFHCGSDKCKLELETSGEWDGADVKAIWQGIRERTKNVEGPYGDVVMCDGWRSSYASFQEDMGWRKPGESCDRIDPFAGYTCGHCGDCKFNGWLPNCRWADRHVQSLNKRKFWKGFQRLKAGEILDRMSPEQIQEMREELTQCPN